MNFVVYREHHLCSVLGEGSSKKLEWWISSCHSTMTVTTHKINLISKCFIIVVRSCLGENCVSISRGNSVKFEQECNAW